MRNLYSLNKKRDMVARFASLHTNARMDSELLKVWLKSHADGSPHTVRVYRLSASASWERWRPSISVGRPKVSS